MRNLIRIISWLSLLSLAPLLSLTALAQSDPDETRYPVQPELFVDMKTGGCEGLAFNAEGRLFATCSRSLLEIAIDGTTRTVADLDSNLGIAAIGERDLLVADFGPTNAFRQDRNTDGVVWRISPDGDKQVDSSGMGDPNFVLVLENGDYLVSDDATADIYLVGNDKTPVLFSTAVSHPNGLALSADGSTLFVAQIFSSIRPVISDDRVWAIDLEDGKPAPRSAKVVARAGPNAAVDGLAMDQEGRIYIAANRAGKLWRYDPATDAMELLAEGIFGIASLAFGVGRFDHESVFASTTFSAGRGGKIWRIPVNSRGAKLYR